MVGVLLYLKKHTRQQSVPTVYMGTDIIFPSTAYLNHLDSIPQILPAASHTDDPCSPRFSLHRQSSTIPVNTWNDDILFLKSQSFFVWYFFPLFSSLLFSHCLMIWSYNVRITNLTVCMARYTRYSLSHPCTLLHCTALLCTPLHCSALLCSALYILSCLISSNELALPILHAQLTVCFPVFPNRIFISSFLQFYDVLDYLTSGSLIVIWNHNLLKITSHVLSCHVKFISFFIVFFTYLLSCFATTNQTSIFTFSSPHLS